MVLLVQPRDSELHERSGRRSVPQHWARDDSSSGRNREGDEFSKLKKEYSSQYKSIVVRANYLSSDRPDIQYASKE